MIDNLLQPLFWNNTKRKPIILVPKSIKKHTENSRDSDERPTLIQFSPPYLIYLRNRMFNVIIMKQDDYQYLTLNDQPLRAAFCQFIHKEAAVFVFNEVISIIDFSKQLNLPVHIFPYGKLLSNSRFYYENNILYIFSQKTIYKVPILSTQVSDFSNIFSIQDDDFNKKASIFTIACNNFILRYGNEFRIAKPKNAGTFAATMLIQNGNIFDCITSLDSQPTTKDRSEAYKECFIELWEKDHKEKALIIACNPHFRVKLYSVISLFDIFNEQSDDKDFPELNTITAVFYKNDEHPEIYKRLKFYLDQRRQRLIEKGTSPNELDDINSYIIMYLCYFHEKRKLVDFLKTINNLKSSKKVDEFLKKFHIDFELGIEESLFYSGTGRNEEALNLFKNFYIGSNVLPKYETSDYEFNPQMEAIKILKKPKSNSTTFKDYKWIFRQKNFIDYSGLYYYLPDKEDYDAEVINEDAYDYEKKLNNFKDNEFDLNNWMCMFYIEWLRCKNLDIGKRYSFSVELFRKLKQIQSDIMSSHSKEYFNKKRDDTLWIESIRNYYDVKLNLDSKSTNQQGELNASSALEQANKEIEDIIKDTIIRMKQDPVKFNDFKKNKDVILLINNQVFDFKKELKWLIEDYKDAIELESEGTTSESQIIKKCKSAINPAEAFKSYDKTHKDVLERKTGPDKFEWEEKIEFLGLSDFIKDLDDSTSLKVASPFLTAAISLMTSRIHNLQQTIEIQKQVLVEEKMKAAYDQIHRQVESRSQKLLNTD